MTFFWDNGQAQIVGEGVSLYAVAPGANGEVIGWMRGPAVHAFIWQAGRLTDLGDGTPQAINSRGEIVGYHGCCSATRAMLWREKRG